MAEQVTNVGLQIESYLIDKIKTLEKSEYFSALEKMSINSYLIGIYNIPILLMQYTTLIATNLTKTTVICHINSIINMLYLTNCLPNKNKVENFNLFLSQFHKTNTYISENYYKQNSIVFAIDKACNELCQMAVDKSFFTCIASCMTIEFIIAMMNKKLNSYAKSHLNGDIYFLNESNINANILINIFNNGTDVKEIIEGVDSTIKIFSGFFSDLAKSCY